MELYFTRHGKTQWNQERRFQGSNGDSPLLPQSYEEIKAFGKKVKYVPLKQFIPVQQSEHVIQQKVSTKSLLVR